MTDEQFTVENGVIVPKRKRSKRQIIAFLILLILVGIATWIAYSVSSFQSSPEYREAERQRLLKKQKEQEAADKLIPYIESEIMRQGYYCATLVRVMPWGQDAYGRVFRVRCSNALLRVSLGSRWRVEPWRD